MSDRTYDYERDRDPVREPEADTPSSETDPDPESPETEASEEPSFDQHPTWRPAREADPSSSPAPAAEVEDPVAEPEQSGGWDDEAESSEENVIEEPSGVMGVSEHAPGELMIPPGVPVLEGEPRGERRAVGIVVSRFNGEVTSKLLESALAELDVRGVDTNSITVMPVPGAFELPIAAMALAKTRRFACIVALGCVIRGDTPHFEYVSAETASGLQLAAIETGVPVAFGVLTLDRHDQAEARYDKGAEAVRTGLEMADVFANLRAAAAR
jgi:6,7-dimethyl-8-ribityllumazine synthase